MSLFKSRTHYKPFDYEWAFEAYDMQCKRCIGYQVKYHCMKTLEIGMRD